MKILKYKLIYKEQPYDYDYEKDDIIRPLFFSNSY